MFAGVNVRRALSYGRKATTVTGTLGGYFASGDGWIVGDDGVAYRFNQGAAGVVHPVQTGQRVSAVVGDDGVATTLTLLRD